MIDYKNHLSVSNMRLGIFEIVICIYFFQFINLTFNINNYIIYMSEDFLKTHNGMTNLNFLYVYYIQKE